MSGKLARDGIIDSSYNAVPCPELRLELLERRHPARLRVCQALEDPSQSLLLDFHLYVGEPILASSLPSAPRIPAFPCGPCVQKSSARKASAPRHDKILLSMSAPPYLGAIYSDNTFLGTGVLVAPDRLLTCRHVIEVPAGLEVRINGRTTEVLSTEEDTQADLALLQLDTRFADPPPWTNEAHESAHIDMIGFRNGRLASEEGRIVSVQRDEPRQLLSVDASCSGVNGMSGGVITRTINGQLHCVALLTEGGKGAFKSILQGGAPIADFLAGHGIALNGWPRTAPPQPPPEPDDSRYIEWLRNTTGWIDLRGFKVGSAQANRMPIDRAYIVLRGRDSQPIEKRLTRERRCVVIQGEAGSGKSTLLKHIAFHLAESRKRYPLYLRVVDLDHFITKCEHAAGMPTLPDSPAWIAHLLASLDHGLDADFFLRKLKSPDTIVLVDGLDEAPNETRRRAIAALLSKAAEYPCSFVVTTRPGADVGFARPASFVTEELAGLEDESVERFLRDWSGFLFPDDTAAAELHFADLSEQVSATPEVRELANNPMMLTALAVIHWNQKRLPNDRAELYDSILQWLAISREHREGRQSPARCLEILRELALGMQTHLGGRMKQAEWGDAVSMIGAHLTGNAAHDFLNQEQLDSGIVVSRTPRTIEFVHLTFQEYLAARELADNRSESEQREILFRGSFRYTVEWREFLRLLGSCSRAQGQRKAQTLFTRILDAAGSEPPFVERVRTVALIWTMLQDLRDFTVADERYGTWVRSMEQIFDGAADGQGLDIWTRATAAEAWESLGDTSRLRLPSDPDYWVRIGGFEIGRCPVTVYEYSIFLRETGGAPPPAWERQARFPLRPVVRVDRADSRAYCDWCAPRTRLPNEDEWYLAAAGNERREFSWGADEPDGDRANFNSEIGRPTPVGLFPQGASSSGLLDLAGNVWERTDARLRGGSFSDAARDLRASYRNVSVLDLRLEVIGFRCVREVSP